MFDNNWYFLNPLQITKIDLVNLIELIIYLKTYLSNNVWLSVLSIENKIGNDYGSNNIEKLIDNFI